MPPPRHSIGKWDLRTLNEFFACFCKTQCYRSNLKLTEFFTPNSSYQEKPAFTLAEVLITLGIIGVVAAMTMPSLIQNTKKSEVTARIKKFNSMMQQAIIMSELENGETSDWIQTGTSDTVTQAMTTNEYFMKYFAPYMKYIRIKETGSGIIVYFVDGSTSQIYKGGCMDFIFDTNGEKRPNAEGRDKFRFLACPAKSTWCEGRNWCSYYQTSQKSREQRLQNCKRNGIYCSGLLEYDNWEFKDDYPIRL